MLRADRQWNLVLADSFMAAVAAGSIVITLAILEKAATFIEGLDVARGAKWILLVAFVFYAGFRTVRWRSRRAATHQGELDKTKGLGSTRIAVYSLILCSAVFSTAVLMLKGDIVLSPGNLQTQLQKAALKEDWGKVDRLLWLGVDLEAVDNEGLTVIQRAAMLGYNDAVRGLYDRGAGLNTAAVGGDSPLHLVCGSKGMRASKSDKVNRDATARFLLDKGVDPSLRDHAGRTALDWARIWHDDIGDRLAGVIEDHMAGHQKAP
ncbi:MAG: ankyrin repeat domain-containing protein [Planctomycetes bacterium]|nr:ankyrin repeat domain-containing protein [Planctomycetota bacterium]